MLFVVVMAVMPGGMRETPLWVAHQQPVPRLHLNSTHGSCGIWGLCDYQALALPGAFR